jgi:hypothetical protein
MAPQNGLSLTDQSEAEKASKSKPVNRASHVIHHSFLDLLQVALRSDQLRNLGTEYSGLGPWVQYCGMLLWLRAKRK